VAVQGSGFGGEQTSRFGLYRLFDSAFAHHFIFTAGR
jgi:hypothetical protein